MADLGMVFWSLLVFSLGIFCIVFGGFTAYFGTGRSRNIGGSLILFGLCFLIIVLWFTGVIPDLTRPIQWELDVLYEGVVAVIGALIGALIALGVFLMAIMKS
jgi:hypothetical protein